MIRQVMVILKSYFSKYGCVSIDGMYIQSVNVRTVVGLSTASSMVPSYVVSRAVAV